MIPPQVEVLLAVHHGGSHLTEAVESILGLMRTLNRGVEANRSLGTSA